MARTKNSKVCLKCGRVLPISDYYSNKDWKEQTFHDAWCRDCYGRYCKDEASVQEYFFYNNRKYDPTIWEGAVAKAEYNLSNNSDYITASYGDKKRLQNEAAARLVPSFMNLVRYYTYVENTPTQDAYDLEKQRQKEKEEQEEKLEYSPVWRGKFTREQIATLDAMYEEYEKDFDTSNVNRRDYIRKVIKASFDADLARDRMSRGEISVAEYDKIQKVFDDLSKSSALAETSRKAGTATSLNALGNIILGLEINHHLDINPYTFPEDDVDKVSNDYAHLATAVGAQL